MKKRLGQFLPPILIVLGIMFVSLPHASAAVTSPPVFTAEPGAYSGAVDVCIPGTLDLRPYYSIDGSDPLTSPTRIYGSQLYNHVYLDSSTTLRAVLSWRGDPNDLGPETAGYYEIIPIPAPMLCIPGGTDIGSQTVTITNYDDVIGNHAAFYTVDGTDPATSSSRVEYTGPISVDTSQTVKAAFVRYTRNYLPGGINDAEEGPLWGPVSSASFGAVGNQEIEAFVTRFYQLCLQRQPDVVGLPYWVDQLATGEQTGAAVAQNFIFSVELMSRNLNFKLAPSIILIF